jgi:hypothetical protein
LQQNSLLAAFRFSLVFPLIKSPHPLTRPPCFCAAQVISHDRWFLDRICTHILAFEGDGRTVFVEGNFRYSNTFCHAFETARLGISFVVESSTFLNI